MANWASTAYAIEGPKEVLEKIRKAIVKAIEEDDNRYEEYKACEFLGFSIESIDKACLGGIISEKPEFRDGTLRFWAEERWGLQHFNRLLEEHFLDIKVYWVVEESGCEVYATNDKEGKYFPERYWVDTAQDDIYQSEYFKTEEAMWKWLSEKYGVKSKEEVEAWNANYEAIGDDCENFINIHVFSVVD